MTTPTKKLTYLSWFVLIFVIAVGMVMCRPTQPPAVSTDDIPKVYQPVVYDVATWQTSGTRLKPSDSDAIKSLIGATASSEVALDYDGHHAQKYRYVAQHEPPLYIIESDRLMELVWYYADAKDDDVTKQKSTQHAQRAYRVAHALYGDDGRTLMQTMLDGKPTPKQTGLILASCLNYQCRMIWQK